MDVVFNCPNCSQELEVDQAAVGQQIDCPSCNQKITIPTGAPAPPAAPPKIEPPPAKAGDKPPATEAPKTETTPPPAPAAPPPEPKKVPYSVPQHEKVEEVLTKKAAPPEAPAPKDQKKRIRTRTIRRNQCMEVGHDKFDEVVSAFLESVGDENVVSITPITYGFVDTVGHMLNDYGVLIVYKG